MVAWKVESAEAEMVAVAEMVATEAEATGFVMMTTTSFHSTPVCVIWMKIWWSSNKGTTTWSPAWTARTLAWREAAMTVSISGISFRTTGGAMMMMNLAKSVTLEKTETASAKGLFPVSARDRKYTLTIFPLKE